MKTQKIIKIPRLNDGSNDFRKLFEIFDSVKELNENIKFDFSLCVFLRPNAVAFLGGLARYIEYNEGIVSFDWNSCLDEKVIANIRQNGFAKAFGALQEPWTGESIPYREDKVVDANGIMDYLTDGWLKHEWVHMSKRLTDAIAGKMWEIYNNAFEHSETHIGVFSCGQHFKKEENVLFSVVDFGQGIPTKIRNYVANFDPVSAQKLPAEACLRCAFTRGNTTSIKEGVPRGLGLDLLKEFVQLNEGKLEVYSNEGYVRIDKDGESYQNLQGISFKGTIFHITLRCDEKYYRFIDEPNS